MKPPLSWRPSVIVDFLSGCHLFLDFFGCMHVLTFERKCFKESYLLESKVKIEFFGYFAFLTPTGKKANNDLKSFAHFDLLSARSTSAF